MGAGLTQKIDKTLLPHLFTFVRDHIAPILRPAPMEVFDFTRWVEGMDWPRRKKDKLIEFGTNQLAWLPYAFSRGIIDESELEKKLAFVYKLFQKKEPLGKFDIPRNIASMTDAHRVFYGDLMKRISDKLISNQFTYHGIPVHLWCAVTWERMGPEARLVFGTDFKRFESFFWSAMKTLLITLPSLLLCAFPEDTERALDEFTKEMELLGVSSKDFAAQLVEAVQKSGAHLTYGGNTMGHIICSLFIDWYFLGIKPVFAPEAHVHNAQILTKGPSPADAFSGDDGIKARDPGEKLQEPRHYSELGIAQTLESSGKDGIGFWVAGSSFCSSNLEFSGKDAVLVIDALKYLARLSWIDGRMRKAKRSKQLALVKAKALSYLHRSPSTPVISLICATFLCLPEIKHVDVRSAVKHFDAYKRANIRQAIADAQVCLKECKRVTGRATLSWNGYDVHPLYRRPSADQYALAEKLGLPAMLARTVENDLRWDGLDANLSALNNLFPASHLANFMFYTSRSESWAPLFNVDDSRRKWERFFRACGTNTDRISVYWSRGETW